MKIFKVDSHIMEKESLIEAIILKCLFTCYLGNEHYCTYFYLLLEIEHYLSLFDIGLDQNILLKRKNGLWDIMETLKYYWNIKSNLFVKYILGPRTYIAKVKRDVISLVHLFSHWFTLWMTHHKHFQFRLHLKNCRL